MLFIFPPPSVDIVSALAEPWVIVATVLLPVLSVRALLRHYVALKAGGTSPVARARATAQQPPLLGGLSQAATVLALLCGGLLVQIGYVTTIHGGLAFVLR